MVFKKDFIYLFLERGEERERNVNVWLPLMWPPVETWPTTQACALTGNGTGDPSQLVLNPLSHTSQGFFYCLLKIILLYWYIFKQYIVLSGLILNVGNCSMLCMVFYNLLFPYRHSVSDLFPHCCTYLQFFTPITIYYSTVWNYDNLFIHSLVGGHLVISSSRLLRLSQSILVHISWCTWVRISLGHIVQGGWPGHGVCKWSLFPNGYATGTV